MSSTATLSEEVVLARQPILNAAKETPAYELLYRSANSQSANVTDARHATASVIVNALNSVGLSTLVGKAKAFINCDRSMLLDTVFTSLDPKVFVLEVLEDVEGDEAVAKAVAGYKQAGFEIALDDFVMSPEHLARVERLVRYATYVKLDLTKNSLEQIRDAARYFRDRTSAKMLAEKVETKQDFVNCHRLGYTLFQGYFFARPEIISGRKLDTKARSVLNLLQLLDREADVEELEDAFKKAAELTVSLLKYINSAAVGLSTEIESIHQALSLVGYRKLQSWLTLLLYAQSQSAGSKSNCLMDHAVQRARFMENLAQRAGADKGTCQSAFFTGMMSCMDALCNQQLEGLVAEFKLGEEVTQALLHREGLLGKLLSIATWMESGDFAKVGEACPELEVSLTDVQEARAESWAWAAKNR